MVVSVADGLEQRRLLALLADGAQHTVESLARALGQPEAAVDDGAKALRASGVPVQAAANHGLRLGYPVELLDARRILEGLGGDQRANLQDLEVLFEVDSTNTRLLAAPPSAPGGTRACLSELQHAGRGRRGRRWVAPFGSGIAFSLSWNCSNAVRTLPALSLGVGVAVSRALVRAGANGVVLKWPNDIWFRDRKIGGVLIETRAGQGGLTHVVIGIGLNVNLPEAARREIEAGGVSVTAVADACEQPPSRNFIAGAILDELLSMLAEYERSGFGAFRDAWIGLDALRGRRAQVMVGDQATVGIARGVDEDGALLLETSGRLQHFYSGEASLRLAQG
jgi:BirA family biotin operon repressor/biotin-[acetyl-CoA-carboxylase] ligase